MARRLDIDLDDAGVGGDLRHRQPRYRPAARLAPRSGSAGPRRRPPDGRRAPDGPPSAATGGMKTWSTPPRGSTEGRAPPPALPRRRWDGGRVDVFGPVDVIKETRQRAALRIETSGVMWGQSCGLDRRQRRRAAGEDPAADRREPGTGPAPERPGSGDPAVALALLQQPAQRQHAADRPMTARHRPSPAMERAAEDRRSPGRPAAGRSRP